VSSTRLEFSTSKMTRRRQAMRSPRAPGAAELNRARRLRAPLALGGAIR
jgi:hypothetical protein